MVNVSLVDTSELNETMKLKNPEIDNIQLDQIQKVISWYNIRIKGILFLVNFQNERFDADEQEALLKYNQIFPLKRFWKNIINELENELVKLMFYPPLFSKIEIITITVLKLRIK